MSTPSQKTGHRKISTKAKIEFLRIKIEGDELALKRDKEQLAKLESQLKVLLK